MVRELDMKLNEFDPDKPETWPPKGEYLFRYPWGWEVNVIRIRGAGVSADGREFPDFLREWYGGTDYPIAWCELPKWEEQ